MSRQLPYKDYEGAMVKAQLMKIENYANKLNEMIKDDDEIESWVQAKLTKVDAYMGDVKHYLDYAYDKKFGNGGMPDKGQSDEELYNALTDMGYKFEDDNEFSETAVNLGYRWDEDKKMWFYAKAKGGNIDSVEITFDEDEYSRNQSLEIEVKSGENTYDIYGNIIPFHTGRAEEYEFEPSWFSDNESEKFYSENWEDIEELVIDAYNKELAKKNKRKRL